MSLNLFLIFLCSAIIQTGNLLLTATGTLIGLNLSKTDSLSTIPIFINIISSLLMIIPVSFLMVSFGRQKIFIFGYISSFIGLSLFILGLNFENFYIFSSGAIFSGISFSIANYYRFAAVEISAPEYKAKAISFVLVSGVVSALIGPNLYKWGNYLFSATDFKTGYILLIPFYSIGIILLFFLKTPKAHNIDLSKSRKSIELIKETSFLPIMTLNILAAVIMIFIMTATPLGMKFHNHDANNITTIIQYHVLGMFVPSFFTGYLIKNLGTKKIMYVGTIFYFFCIGINFFHHTFFYFAVSLVFLGIGWNFLFISATTLLTEKIEPKDQPRAQALNDFFVTGFGALAVVFSGKIHSEIGWANLNLLTIPLIVLAIYLIASEKN